MNILVVDADVFQVRALGRGLRIKGYQVIEAFAAEKAMEIIKHPLGAKLDLVLMEYLMPGTNGLQLLRDIRKRHSNLPAILTTAFLWDRNILIEALHSRCNGYLEKPFTLDQLIFEIQRVIKPPAFR